MGRGRVRGKVCIGVREALHSDLEDGGGVQVRVGVSLFGLGASKRGNGPGGWVLGFGG